MDLSCPGLGSDEHFPLSPLCIPQEKAAMGCSASRAVYTKAGFLMQKWKVLREPGEALPHTASQAALDHQVGPTRGHVNPASISLPDLTCMNHCCSSPSPFPSPSRPVFTLCFSAFCPEKLSQIQAKLGEDLFKSSALKDVGVAKTFPGICKI